MSEKSRTVAALVPWLSLLVAGILICQIDRVNLAVAAPLLKDEFHLNPWQLGILFSERRKVSRARRAISYRKGHA